MERTQNLAVTEPFNKEVNNFIDLCQRNVSSKGIQMDCAILDLPDKYKSVVTRAFDRMPEIDEFINVFNSSISRIRITLRQLKTSMNTRSIHRVSPFNLGCPDTFIVEIDYDLMKEAGYIMELLENYFKIIRGALSAVVEEEVFNISRTLEQVQKIEGFDESFEAVPKYKSTKWYALYEDADSFLNNLGAFIKLTHIVPGVMS